MRCSFFLDGGRVYLRVCNHILVSYYSRGANNNALSTIGLVVLHKPNIYSLHSMLYSKKTIVEKLQLLVRYVSESADASKYADIHCRRICLV